MSDIKKIRDEYINKLNQDLDLKILIKSRQNYLEKMEKFQMNLKK